MQGIVTHPEAQTELDRAAAWYEERRAGLGSEFLTSIEGAVAAIKRSPKAFPLFKNTSLRKVVVRRFPYLVFFEERQEDIWIFAFAHAKQKPGYWLERIEEEEPGQ